MANCIHCHRTLVENKRCLKEQLISSLFLVLFASMGVVFSLLTYAFDWFWPHCLRWRRTSRKQLEEVDHEILKALPCVQEKRMVDVGVDRTLWSIVCNRQGPGTPLLLVHGMGGGVGLWAMNLEALSRQRPVYAFDLLGFGRSSHPSFPMEPQEAEDVFVESIEKYRAAMGLESFILVGHSLGGFLSASYALRYPQYVRHLVLVDPWGFSPHLPDDSKNLHYLVRLVLQIICFGYPLSAVRLAGPFGQFLVSFYRPALAQTFASKLGDEKLLHRYIYHCNAQHPSGEMGFSNMSFQLAWAKEPMFFRLHALDPDLPLTFVYGARSWINRTTGWKIKSLRQGYVDVQIIRGAGHHVYADRWDLFNTLVDTVAISVDHGTLPAFDTKLVKRIHAAPTVPHFPIPNPNDLDLQRPLGHWDENVSRSLEEEEEEEVKDGDVPVFSLPHSS